MKHAPFDRSFTGASIDGIKSRIGRGHDVTVTS